MDPKTMKLAGVLLLLGTVTAAWAQDAVKVDVRGGDKEERANAIHGERRAGEGGLLNFKMDQGAIIMRMLSNPKILAEADISTEQATKLRGALNEIEKKMIDLDAEIKKASITQAELMSKLLADTQSSPKELLATVEKIGGWRTEQAKLQIQRMVVIREHLTPDQIAKIRAAAREVVEKMRNEVKRRQGDEAPVRNERARVREGGKAARPAPPEGWGE